MKEKSLKMSLLSIFCIIAVVSLSSLGSSNMLSLMEEWPLYRAILGPHPWKGICLSQHTFTQITEVWKYFQFSVLGRKYQWIRISTDLKSICYLWSREEVIGLRFEDQFSSVQLLSCVQLFATPWIAARQASLSITSSRSSLKLTSIESVMPSSHLILCHPLFLLPPIPPSIRVFSNESTLHMRWPKYWSFSFSIISSKEHPGLISFRMDWLDLLAVQRTLKSLLQHHSSKASILRCSAFFTV